MNLIDTLRIYLSTYIVHEKNYTDHRAEKIDVIRADVQPSLLREAKRRA